MDAISETLRRNMYYTEIFNILFSILVIYITINKKILLVSKFSVQNKNLFNEFI